MYWLLFIFSFVVSSLQSFHESNIQNYVQYGTSSNTRARRSEDVNLDICSNDKLDNEAKKKIKRHSFPLKDDSNYDLQLVWLGDKSETQFLLTTADLHFLFGTQHKPSKLYESTDLGFTFENVQQRINNTEIRSQFGIMKSLLNNNKLIFISYEYQSSFGSYFNALFKNFKSSLIITEDGGKTFHVVELPFKLREGEPLLFNPKKEDWILALEEATTTVNLITNKKTVTGEAWISKDFGKTWTVMLKGHKAQSVKWGAANGKEGEEIYLSTEIDTGAFSFFGSNFKMTLWKSDDGGKFFDEIVEHCYSFGVQGDFVFVTVDFNTSDSSEVRKMHVSKDSGKNFYPVSVPEVTEDKFFAVVEMFKDMIFLHVDDEGDTGRGTLFISDADGLMYTKSLDDHFYTNSGFTDFYKVESMFGVYITKVLLPDNTLKAVITYNRGLTWYPIKVNAEYCKNITGECSLHYHHSYSKTKGISVPPPLSSENAAGIILMHGMVGDGLTGESNVWLSVNGGYDWKMIAKGPHLYAIGDMGNLIIIYPLVNTTGNKVKYSIDMGRCWNEYEFIDTNDEITIRGLVTEPHSKDRVFSLWGYVNTNGKGQKEWTVITINFHDMFTKKCEAKDLEEWYPHDKNGKSGCLLGEQLTYVRPLLDATCYLGNDFYPLVKKVKCTCSKDDLECDYGYLRQADGSCVVDKKVKPIEVCQKGELMEKRFSQGYRRVPGNQCDPKGSLDDTVKYIDEKKTCRPSVINVEGIIQLEKEEREREESLKKKEAEREQQEFQERLNEIAKQQKANTTKKSSSLGIAIFISIVAVLTLVGITVWCIRRRRLNKVAGYTMSNLREYEIDDREPLNEFDPRPKSRRPYTDETDAEDDIMLPV